MITVPTFLDIAASNGATNVRVFGSVARKEEHQASDVDLLVDIGPGRSLLDQVRLRRDLTNLLGTQVDIVTSGGLLDRDTAILEVAIPISMASMRFDPCRHRRGRLGSLLS